MVTEQKVALDAKGNVLEDQSPCAGVRADLKNCLLQSDCVKKGKKTPRECLQADDGSIPTECQALRNLFFECKRSMLDQRYFITDITIAPRTVDLMALQASKKAARRKLQEVLNSMGQENKAHQSSVIAGKVLRNPFYRRSKRIGIYLSTQEEVDTDALVRDILTSGKLCFVPRCSKGTMLMERLKSVEDYENLAVNAWGIKEPLSEEERESCLSSGGVDLLLVPGLGFTLTGLRLGRGKGYYDKFLEELKSLQATPFTTIGLAFKEQVLDDLPVGEHDFRLDDIITA